MDRGFVFESSRQKKLHQIFDLLYVWRFFSGIHLAYVGFLGGEPIEDLGSSEPYLLIIRILIIVFFYLHQSFIKTSTKHKMIFLKAIIMQHLLVAPMVL